MLTKNRIVGVVVLVSLLITGMWVTVFADGEESLGPPSIDIAPGSGVVAAGTGMDEQPGTIDLEVPAGATINQVLLYWSGASINDVPGDDTITVAGVDITGTEVGLGPGTKMFRSYRADITNLGLVASGTNSLAVENMDFNSENDGAGILVIYDDGMGVANIELRDGLDIAYINRPEPGKTTVPQTFTFDPQPMDVEAEIVVMVGSVRTGGPRPNAIHITVGGQLIELVNPLDSADGRQWDTLTIPVTIPAGASDLTIEVLSKSDGTSNTPASLTWVNATLSVPMMPVTNCADFSGLTEGTPVEGLGAVHPLIDIQSSGNVQVMVEGKAPIAYRTNSDQVINGNLGADNGFADRWQRHDYTFTFAPDAEIGYLSLRMMDYGDWNPFLATEHYATLTAYDANNNVLDEHLLAFSGNGVLLPRKSTRGDLNMTGDALTARQGEPGNFVFEVFDSGNQIDRVELRFANNSILAPNRSSDPLFALKDLCFGSPPPPPVCVDLTALAPGTSIEGMGTVHPDFGIATTGNTIVVVEGQSPAAYSASNSDKIPNNGVGPGHGFTDILRHHDYVFSFAPDVEVGTFSIRMLDYGDWNPHAATEHHAALVAYDAAGNVIDEHMLSFTNNGSLQPRKSSVGDLFIVADAVSAHDGEPGRMLYRVANSSTPIDRVELRFSSDATTNRPSDPLFALNEMCYVPFGQ